MFFLGVRFAPLGVPRFFCTRLRVFASGREVGAGSVISFGRIGEGNLKHKLQEGVVFG